MSGSWNEEHASTTISFFFPFRSRRARLFFACALLRLSINIAVVPANANTTATAVLFLDIQVVVLARKLSGGAGALNLCDIERDGGRIESGIHVAESIASRRSVANVVECFSM